MDVSIAAETHPHHALKMTQEEPLDFLLLGPAAPYRGGIADTQHALAKSLTYLGYKVKLFTFTQLYPALLFPGKTQFTEETENHPLSIERKVHAYHPLQWKHVAKTINQLQPKAVVFRYWTPFLAPCWTSIAKRLNPSIKKVGWVDNWQAHEPKPWDRFLTQRFEKSMDLFTTLSTTVAKEIKGNSQKRVWGKMHPIEANLPKKLDQKEARKKLNFPEDKTALLFFGLIRPYKGLAILIEALKYHPEKHLFIVGECYEKWGSYQQLIERYQLEKQITVINRFVSYKEAAIYFSAVDATILPYTSATQSGVIALAYHYETPLVVTNHPGLLEAVLSDKTGYICMPETNYVKEAITAVTDAAENKTYRENLKQTKANYSWEVYAIEWANFILHEATKH